MSDWQPTFVNGELVNDRRKAELKSKRMYGPNDELEQAQDAIVRLSHQCKEKDRKIEAMERIIDAQRSDIRNLNKYVNKGRNPSNLIRSLDLLHTVLKQRLDMICALRDKARAEHPDLVVKPRKKARKKPKKKKEPS